MKEKVNLMMLMEKSNKKELTILHNLIKKHSYFKGERRKLYRLIVKYKKFEGGK